VKLARIAALVLTLVSLLLASRLNLSKDLTTLFPRTPEADALARMTLAFGGGDVALVLVRGEDRGAVERAAESAARELSTCASVRSVVTSPPSPEPIGPTDAWRFAGPIARDRLAHAVTEEGMRERLRETRALLLAPGAGEAVDLLRRDPLRLAVIPWQDRVEIAAGARGAVGSAFVADEGRARLVIVEPKGRAFESGEAARFTTEANAALDRVRSSEPGVRLDLTGGHVVARETEQMMRSDLTTSGAVSVILASIVFVVTFRRPRAVIAVLPPLAAGTLWTTALAALLYPRLSAVATAFAAVVIGVGVDTGVHVYARLLHGRREGLAPAVAAAAARRETWKPTMGAALAAAGAFGCLLLSDIEGMKQLGVLCGAGEVLTSIAILIVVPDVGALLERGDPPKPARARWVVALTRTRARSIVALVLVAACTLPALVMGRLKIEHAVATLDAKALPSLATYDAIYAIFGGARGQLMVVSADVDRERARARSDAVAEAAERVEASGAVTGFDALSRFAPSLDAQRARLAERDRLDLPSRRAMLERALEAEGFSVPEFTPALEAFAHPSTTVADVLATTSARSPVLSWLERRHLATDSAGTIAVVYVRVAPGADEVVKTTLHGADPSSTLTSYADLEKGLVRALDYDLPRVLAGALVVVVVVLGASLRRPSRVALAVAVLAVEIAIVVGLARLTGVRWHVYDALVLPVLLGITLDEVLFLIEAVQRSGSIEDAITEQAPLGSATALTTAAGFAALGVCRFDGLVDVGKVGALGSVVGLVVALVAVPAVYRLRARYMQPS
jgi:predicted RND superfamily exporter protein